MRKSILISVVLTALLSVSALASKESTSIDKEISAQKKISQSIPKEVLQAFNDTLGALQALEKGDEASAKKYLIESSTIFDTVIKENPSLKLLPISSQMELNEVDATPKDIKKALQLVEDALKGYHLEDARVILSTLRDELTVNTQYIPMEIYNVLTKDALKALDKGDEKDALRILMSGFNTFVLDTVIVPLPILTASDMVLAASVLEKEDKQEATALLEGAKEELEKAKLLGYADSYSEDYTLLRKDIEFIQKEIKGKNVVEKLYDKLKLNFHSLIGKVKGNSYKDSTVTKEVKELVHPESLKKMEAAKAKVAATHEKDLKEAKAKAQSFANDAQGDKAKTLNNR